MAKRITKQELQIMKVGDIMTREGLEVRKTTKGLVYYASSQVHGQRLRDNLGAEADGMNLTRARIALKALHNTVPRKFQSGRASPEILFSDAAAYYVETLRDSGGRNLKQKVQQLNMHWRPFFGQCKVKKITTLSIDKYCHARLQAGAAVSTVNRELATVRHMFNQLSEWGVVETDHIKVKNRKGERRKTKTFSEDQIRLMLNAALIDSDPYTYLFVLIGFQTSMRHGEILNVKFEHFDYDISVLHIPVAKAGQREVPVHQDLLAAIRNEGVRRSVTSGYVFGADSPTGRRTYMKKQFNRCLKAAGLEGLGLTPHSMRHTAISIIMRSGVSVADAMAISGHKTPQMLLHYTHANNQSVRRAVDALAHVTGARPAPSNEDRRGSGFTA